jgi:hypothetical protein
MTEQINPSFPDELLDWAGHRAGGVRRLFNSGSGRPSGAVIHTPLLARLEVWAENIARDAGVTPRTVLLIGGPGNGKTESIEYAINKLDRHLGFSGSLSSLISEKFIKPISGAAPRLAHVDLNELSDGKIKYQLSVVQDASERDPARPDMSPGALLVEELQNLLSASSDNKTIYLSCINRGILDDAITFAEEKGDLEASKLISSVIQSISMAAKPKNCWPLDDFPEFAAWPMDVESLLAPSPTIIESPANQVLSAALKEENWPTFGSCDAGENCPFCQSRKNLSKESSRNAMLKILRYSELVTGTRWNFRDYFSLVSTLLAGGSIAESTDKYSPCLYAKWLLDPNTKKVKDWRKNAAPYLLVSLQYQHAFFGAWDLKGIHEFRRHLKSLGMSDDPALDGLYQFLRHSGGGEGPSTMRTHLSKTANLLDPALADPYMNVAVSAKTTIKYKEIDKRFSQGVHEGMTFLQKYQVLSTLEIYLLKLLAEADTKLFDSDLVKGQNSIASKVQGFIRDFACRLSRRSIGTRVAAVKDRDVLETFESIVDGNDALLRDAIKRVSDLLNEDSHFHVSLNTTFGEPSPPTRRRAILVTDKQRVSGVPLSTGDHPRGLYRFIAVGREIERPCIPLTYDLYRSVSGISNGMSPASLPRPVVALLDTTKAKLAGSIVRDANILDGAEIKLGTCAEHIEINDGAEFHARRNA